jgi:hypothetical protein
MSLQLHHDGLHGPPAGSRRTFSRALRRLGVALRLLHAAVVAAKLQRLERDLLFHPGYGGEEPLKPGAERFPQRPLILDDKWDF